MGVPATGNEFLGLLEKSQILDESLMGRLEKKIDTLGSSAHDPKKLAASLVKSNLITAYHARQLLAGKYKGFYIAKYKLLELLGMGGMGKVYLAEQITMQRLVAVKIVRPNKHMSRRDEILKRFTREARAVAALQHSNIIQAFDFDEYMGSPYIVMEYVEGIDVARQVLKYEPLPWPQAADYVLQAAEGLQHAHDSGLVHRDVKPGNMLIDVHGNLKLLDLGLVSCFEKTNDDSLTVQEDQLGTVDYIAPEQALDSHKVDARADIYSLGGSLYFMLTGELLFPDKTTAQKLLAQQTQEPTPVQELAKDTPDEAAAIIEKMLKKDPADRYQTAAEVAEAIRPFAERKVPPYDPDVVKFSRDSIDPYLRRSPDASTITIAAAETDMGGGSESDSMSRRRSQSMVSVSMPETDYGSDSFMDDMSTVDLQMTELPKRRSRPASLPPARGKAKAKAKKKKKTQPAFNAIPIAAFAVAGVVGVAIVGLLVFLFSGDAVEELGPVTSADGAGGPGVNTGRNQGAPSGNNQGQKKGKRVGAPVGAKQWVGPTLTDGQGQTERDHLVLHLNAAMPGSGSVRHFRIFSKGWSQGKMTLLHLRPVGGGQYKVLNSHAFGPHKQAGIRDLWIPSRWTVDRGDVFGHVGAGSPTYQELAISKGQYFGGFGTPPSDGAVVKVDPGSELGKRDYAFQVHLEGVVQTVAPTVISTSSGSWNSFKNEFRKSKDGLVYYNAMESTPKNPAVLRNVAENSSHKQLRARVTGAEFVAGRHPGKMALKFHGADAQDRVVFEGGKISEANLTSEFSFAVWFKVDQFSAPGQMLALHGPHWRLQRNADQNGLSFNANPWGSAEFRRLDSDKSVNDGQWHLAVVTYRRLEGERPIAQAQLFVDGKPEAGVAMPPIEFASPAELRIGASGQDGKTFGGLIDEFAILSRAMDPAEVKTMYDRGKPRS